MRLGPLVLLALIAVVAPSQTHAQVPAPRVQIVHGEGPAVVRPALGTARPDDVVARLMSFDINNDGKIQKAELAERMYTVMDRADADGDGCLDRSEILALATAKPAEAAVRGFGHGRYMVGSETDVSSRRHLEGALDDLRIEATRKEPALAIVRAFNVTREADAEAELLEVIGGILSAEQLLDFNAVLERQRRSPVLQARLGEPGVRLQLSADVERRVALFRLPAEANGRATAALKQYRSRLRPNEADRAELGKQLASILTTEESENFLAAIARQPVVAASGITFTTGMGVGSPQGGPQRTISFVTQ